MTLNSEWNSKKICGISPGGAVKSIPARVRRMLTLKSDILLLLFSSDCDETPLQHAAVYELRSSLPGDYVFDCNSRV